MNEKSVLVIDTPISCAVCPIFQDGLDGYCPVALSSPYNKYNERDKHCPLKPLPEKSNGSVEVGGINGGVAMMMSDYDVGWNDCLFEITGETDE